MPYKKLSDLSDSEALRVLGLLKAHMDSNVGKQMNPFGALTVVRFLEEKIDVLEAETCLENTYAIEQKLSEQDGNFAVYLEFTYTALSHVQDLASHMYVNAGDFPLEMFVPDINNVWNGLQEDCDYEMFVPDSLADPANIGINFYNYKDNKVIQVSFNLTDSHICGIREMNDYEKENHPPLTGYDEKCRYCGSEDMFHYDPEYEEDGTVMLWFNCKTCKKMWKETYAIHKIEVIPEDYDSI